MNEEIEERSVVWESIKEPRTYLNKTDVLSVGSFEVIVLETTVETKTSKKGKKYDDYTLKVRLDAFTEKYIGHVLGSNMDWFGKKVIPVKIKVSVIANGEFLNWDLKLVQAQTKL